MRKTRTYVWLIMLFVVVALFLGLYFLFYPVVSAKDGYVYYLKPGSSRQFVINELAKSKVIPHPALFKLYAYIHVTDRVKSGEYLFPNGATQADIWRQIANGKGLYTRIFTIVPGWTFAQVRQEVNKAYGLRRLTSDMSDKQIMEALGYASLNPEGEFFPETYHYIRDNPDLSVLKRAIDLMQKRLDEAWQGREADLPYKNKYEALIAASLIEKEAFLSSEKPVIAGVLVNRLRKNMLLQFDPTVIYGMGDRYSGKIFKKDLEQDTPYNTYMHKGLPPTPIGMPGMASIEAALHPVQHEYLYFVAKGDGSHQFSKTLDEHELAVNKSRKAI